MSYNYNIGHRPQIWEKTKQETTQTLGWNQFKEVQLVGT